jgi:hypothetical protein
MILLCVYVAALLTRLTLRRQEPTLCLKEGESLREARTILLGIYRVYCWALGATVILVSLKAVLGERSPWWVDAAAVVTTSLVLFLARALYWRLGYEEGRLMLTIGHVTGTFALSEVLFALRPAVQRLADAGHGGAGG